MNNSFFAMLWRMKHINRWGLMRSAFPENLAEHTLSVAYLVHALVLINHRLGGNLDDGLAIKYGLYHDCAEILTGDLPTPVKYHDPDVKTAYKKVESEAEERLLSRLPKNMSDELNDCFHPDSIYRPYVKAADKLSAYLKCLEEQQAGNHDFDKACESTLKSIHDMNLEEAEIFLEEFVPSYGLTLDEL